MKKIEGMFKKNQILTIPNLLSLVRLLLIPVIVWLYSFEHNYYAAIGVILVSGATDIVDGWIARHFNMVSDFGKALDPLADKLTQGAIIICLLSKYTLMWAIVVLFAVGELLKLTLSIIVAKKYDEVDGAHWYGKVNTVIIYTVTAILILFPDIDPNVATVMLAVCGAFMLITHILYARLFIRIMIDKKSAAGEKKD